MTNLVRLALMGGSEQTRNCSILSWSGEHVHVQTTDPLHDARDKLIMGFVGHALDGISQQCSQHVQNH